MSATAAYPRPHEGWQVAMPAVLAVLAAVLWINRDTATAMVLIWARSETFAHAFLVPPISLWLIWRRRVDLASLAPRPAAWALAPLAVAVLAWLLGEMVAVNSVTQLALIAMLVIAVPLVLGWPVTATIFFPLAFLFFAAPVGEFLLPTLIGWTADFTVGALRLSGIPVFREGNQFVIPTGSWSVVEACSGVRYLIASFMVGTLFAYLNYRSTKRRVIFAIVSLVVPIVANWLRAYMIVMLGHLSGNKIAVGADHLIYGWVFFGVVITLLFMIGSRWAEPETAPVPAAAAVDALAIAPTAARIWSVALAAVLVLTAPQAALWAITRGETRSQPQLALPATLAGSWQARADEVPRWKPAFAGSSALAERNYRSPAGEVGVFVAYYRAQGEGHKLVSSQNVLVKSNDPQWNQVESGSRALALAQRALTVRTGRILGVPGAGEAERPRLLAWQLYWVNGTWTSSDYVAKLAGAWHRLRGQGDESAAVVVYAAEGAAGDAEGLLETFVTENLGAIEAALRATRDGR